jgi:hypothetical protein
MKDSSHRILSEIHKLLSASTAQELSDAASEFRDSPNIQRAIEALAAERNGGSARVERNNTERAARPKIKRKLFISHADSIEQVLMDAFRGRSKTEILDLVGNSLPITTNPKEERSRLIRRIARQLREINQENQNAILKDLLVKPDRQTEGWMNVITKGK